MKYPIKRGNGSKAAFQSRRRDIHILVCGHKFHAFLQFHAVAIFGERGIHQAFKQFTEIELAVTKMLRCDVKCQVVFIM